MRRLLIPAVAALFLFAACGEPGAETLNGDSRCRALAGLDPDTRAQAVLRVSDEVGASSAGNPLWLGQIATYCAKRPDATLRAAFGRGDSRPDGETASTDDSAEEVATATPETFEAVRSYRWDAEDESGSGATVRLELGSIVRPDAAVPQEFVEMTGICDVDPQRDAFLPVRISVQNTTDGFDLTPSITVRLSNVKDRFQARVAVDAANAYSDGDQCDAMTAGSIDDGSGVSFEGIEPDGERDHHKLLVLHDYYAPSTPDGDDDALSEWFGSLNIRGDASMMQTTCFDAPAKRFAFTGGFLRMSGALSPGFPLADRNVDRPSRNDDHPPLCADADPAHAIAPDESAADAPCRELNREAKIVTTKTRLGKVRRTFDRAGSVSQVCWGFGAPEGLELTPGMQCALVAASASAVALPSGASAQRACDVLAVRQALETGDWIGEAGGVACGYFAEVFAGAAGVALAGATSPTGPGAAAVGIGTYKALSAGGDLACGGLFDGGAEAAGEKLEADHQRNVAMDIIHKGRCLRETDFHGVLTWSAASCP